MKWPITEKGLAYDRQWMIVDESGASVGLKRSPQMCKIKPIVDEQQGILILNFPGEILYRTQLGDINLCVKFNEKLLTSNLYFGIWYKILPSRCEF